MPDKVEIRPWKPEDAGPLAAVCNNRKIWLNVRDRFPHPYTVGDAVEWIAFTLTQKPLQNFAVLYNDQVAGSIGITPKEDVYRISMEVGYFIGEAFWGRGIASGALSLVLDYIKSQFKVIRVYAEVFSHNAASMKVLEKNGFHLEGIRKKAVIKDNVILDDYVWVKFLDHSSP